MHGKKPQRLLYGQKGNTATPSTTRNMINEIPIIAHSLRKWFSSADAQCSFGDNQIPDVPDQLLTLLVDHLHVFSRKGANAPQKSRVSASLLRYRSEVDKPLTSFTPLRKEQVSGFRRKPCPSIFLY
jgi:hypothetical protein